MKTDYENRAYGLRMENDAAKIAKLKYENRAYDLRMDNDAAKLAALAAAKKEAGR